MAMATMSSRCNDDMLLVAEPEMTLCWLLSPCEVSTGASSVLLVPSVGAFTSAGAWRIYAEISKKIGLLSSQVQPTRLPGENSVDVNALSV